MMNREANYPETIPVIGPPREPRIFTFDQAEILLPVIHKITLVTARELSPLQKQLALYPEHSAPARNSRLEYERIVKSWMGKMHRLGLETCGLWQVEFDIGTGYLCWQYPEPRLGFFREYEQHFRNRKALHKALEKGLPERD